LFKYIHLAILTYFSAAGNCILANCFTSQGTLWKLERDSQLIK